MHNFANFARFHDECRLNSFACRNQIMMNCRYCQERWNYSRFFVQISVRQDDIIDTRINRFLGFFAKQIQGFTKSALAFLRVVKERQLGGFETFVTNIAKNIKPCVVEYGVGKTHHFAVGLVRGENVCSDGAYVFCQRHYKFLPDWVDGGVCNLRKLLTEIIEENLRTVRHNREWRVVSHCGNGFASSGTHRNYSFLDVFASETKINKFAFKIGN